MFVDLSFTTMNTKLSEQSQEIKSKRHEIRILLIVILVRVFLFQMQPAFVGFLGGVAGSFGMRTISHMCMGVTVNVVTATALFPHGELEFHAGLFHFRYSITQDDYDSTREFFLGQDIWSGE
jgi:hypothetical protein